STSISTKASGGGRSTITFVSRWLQAASTTASDANQTNRTMTPCEQAACRTAHRVATGLSARARRRGCRPARTGPKRSGGTGVPNLSVLLGTSSRGTRAPSAGCDRHCGNGREAAALPNAMPERPGAGDGGREDTMHLRLLVPSLLLVAAPRAQQFADLDREWLPDDRDTTVAAAFIDLDGDGVPEILLGNG